MDERKFGMARRSESALLFDAPEGPDFQLEQRASLCHGGPVAGVDEAGRGPLAGPVVVAAVILDEAHIPPGLNDSKKLSEAHRERLFELICARHHVSVAFCSVERIDSINIRGATLWGMARAVQLLPERPAHALFDGVDVPMGLACSGEAVVKGDARSMSIAAASIVAKVIRDRLMVRLDREAPGYGFAAHKGYGTAGHLAARAALGPSVHHRRSFEPVKSMIDPQRSLGDPKAEQSLFVAELKQTDEPEFRVQAPIA